MLRFFYLGRLFLFAGLDNGTIIAYDLSDKSHSHQTIQAGSIIFDITQLKPSTLLVCNNEATLVLTLMSDNIFKVTKSGNLSDLRSALGVGDSWLGLIND